MDGKVIMDGRVVGTVSPGVSVLGIYRSFEEAGQNSQKEARDAMMFFATPHRNGLIEDVAYGDDPPDFMVTTTAGMRIAIEHTRLMRSVAAYRDGDRALGEYKREKAANKDANHHEYEWPPRTEGEIVDALAAQHADKADSINQNTDCDEYWLMFDCATSGCGGGYVDCCFHKQDDVFIDRAAHFWQCARAISAESPYDRIIFFASGLAVDLRPNNPLGALAIPAHFWARTYPDDIRQHSMTVTTQATITHRSATDAEPPC